MTINYDWYTTNYRSVGLQKSLTLFFKFPGQFPNFRDAGTMYQNPGLSWTIRDCPGQSGTYGMYDIIHSKKVE